jgi:hypothetical protein
MAAGPKSAGPDPLLCDSGLFECDWEAGTMRMKELYIPLPDGTAFLQGWQVAADLASSAYTFLGREAYKVAVRSLGRQVPKLRAQGMNSEQIARQLHAQRRALGEAFKRFTPKDLLEKAYARNLQKYGDKLGPTIDWLRAQGKTWEQMIESASRPGGGDLGL